MSHGTHTNESHHRWVRSVNESCPTHMNESRHTSHTWMSHVTHMNESRHTYELSHGTHMKESRHIWVRSMNESCPTYMNESRHTYDWVTSQIWMSPPTDEYVRWISRIPICLSISLSLSLILSLSLSLPRKYLHKHEVLTTFGAPILQWAHLSLSNTYTHILSHTNTLSLSLSNSCTNTKYHDSWRSHHPHTHAHTHTHTHILSLYLSRANICTKVPATLGAPISSNSTSCMCKYSWRTYHPMSSSFSL